MKPATVWSFTDSSTTLQAGHPVPPDVAWRALGVCGIAAVVGGLSMQAHLLAASDLGGALGLSADEASWIPAAGAAAEGAAVLIATYLVAAFGIRDVIVVASLITGAMSVASQIFPSALLILRFIQGLSTGMLPVVMMAWSMRAFPPQRRGLPLMLFAYASSFPSAIALPPSHFCSRRARVGCGKLSRDRLGRRYIADVETGLAEMDDR